MHNSQNGFKQLYHSLTLILSVSHGLIKKKIKSSTHNCFILLSKNIFKNKLSEYSILTYAGNVHMLVHKCVNNSKMRFNIHCEVMKYVLVQISGSVLTSH